MSEREDFDAWFQRRYSCGNFNASWEATAAMGHAWNGWQERARRTVSGQEAEPVAWRYFDGEGNYEYRDEPPSESSVYHAAIYGRKFEPLYLAAPIPATELSDDDLRKLAFKHCYATTDANGWIFAAELDRGLRDFARAIRAAAKEKP